MTESLCPCCMILGKPPARVNFLLLTGLPRSFVLDRISWLLTHHTETTTESTDVGLINYQTLVDVSADLFNQTNQSSPTSSPTASPGQECCHKLYIIPLNVNDVSNLTQWAEFIEEILHELEPKPDPKDEKVDNWCEPPSWIILNESKCLEPKLLDVFLQLNSHKSPLLSFTFTVLCLLGDERQLFENCVLRSVTIHEYESTVYPEYERRIKSFFSLLNSSQLLQQHTLLFEQHKVADDDKLRAILQKLYSHNTSKLETTQEPFRRYMSNLFSPNQRTVHDIRTVRQNLQHHYNRVVEDRLKPLLKNLQETSTVENAARQIVRIVLSDFERMNDEELRVYRRLLVLGFKPNDAQHGTTIAAQLVRYALELLNKNDDSVTPFVYSIILAICILGNHFFFRHELFNHTPEIYTLSMSLVCQRQYALVLVGLRLSTTILNGDQVEHKYAIAFSKHDPQTTRKLIDAIKWLLSPFRALKIQWENEDKEKDLCTAKSDEQDLPSKLAERHCFRHAAILAGRQYVRCLAALFKGSVEHCAQVTVDDVQLFVQVIAILADSRLSLWSRGGKHFSLIVVGDLCAILTPILQYSLLEVSLAVRSEHRLWRIIPDAIRISLRADDVDSELLDACVRFYILLVETKRKDIEFAEDSKPEEVIEPATIEPTEPIIDPSTTLNLTRDLISSYFHLHRQHQKSVLDHEKSTHEITRKLLNMQWEKFDTLQLSHDNERLKQENNSLREEMKQLGSELQRTQSECDQFRKDNTRLAQEIDRLKLISTENSTLQCLSTTISVSLTDRNEEKMIDELQNLSPNEITAEQAEKFIREIHRRRTTFNDHDMRLSICGSLKHLGSDLYTSPVHFLHELIQNAEDNVYNSAVTPRLRIELNHGYILLSNNEQGLRTRDVSAICSLAVSTKRLDEHIGEKGVGFKSVFAASNQPTLISHGWKFAFQVSSSDAMSYIAPVWLSDQDIPEQIRPQIATNASDTHLYLPLKLQPNTTAAEQFLNQVARAVDPCILLTLRRLKTLEIIDERQGQVAIIDKQTIKSTKQFCQQTVTFENLTFVNLTGSLIQLHTSKTGYNHFRVYNCTIDVPTTIEQRRKTRLTLAFPCENDYPMAYTVYAGLPVCDLGLNFLLDADFHLVTNRESVRENVPFNGFLRDHLAVLFVYLLLNDVEIRKNLNHYCPSSTNNHSSWWLIMIDRINELITKNLSSLFDIHTGKSIRRFNADLAVLVSNEQLYNCADIQVVNPVEGVLTEERLKTFQVQPVSLIDVLNCFPDRNEKSNEYRQRFKLWTQKQDKDWWNHLFQHMAQTMTDSIADVLLQKPMFLLQTDPYHRQYLPANISISVLLFISDDSSFRMWKRQLTLLKYNSTFERTALLRSNHVQLLTEERMIEIILHDHLQIAASSSGTKIHEKQIEEVWQDLFYLRSRTDKINKSDRFLVPVSESKSLNAIQDVTLPTLLGMDIRSLLFTPPPTLVLLPYYGVSHNQLDDSLQWEHFLLEMNCQSPSIRLPKNFSITQLPLLPCFTMFISEQSARLAQIVFSNQSKYTQECLRQFPITAHVNDRQEISPVSTTFDETIIHDLLSLPRVTLPSHCRSLAIMLGVRIDYDLRTCITVLQLLSNEKNKNLDLYIQWLGHLQLYVRQQHTELDSTKLLLSCQIYLPDQQQFRSLKDLLIVPDYSEYRDAITLVSKYLNLQMISPSVNQIYWQFKDLFRTLDCTCAVNISHIFKTIHLASCDKNNFHTLGDCTTMLRETGVETIITLFQYLEHLILECVKENKTNTDLFHAIVEQRHPIAPCGSREDWQWRFGLADNSLSEQLRILLGIPHHQNEVRFLTIDQQLVVNSNNTVVYACMEQRIIQHLAKDTGKRYFISPLIVRTCPLVLAAFGIDYVERRGQVLWEHKNTNLEYHLGQLTNIFRSILDDPELEVITSKYASVILLLSDSVILNSNNNKDDESQVDRYMIDIDFPFWVFKKTILLCINFVRDDATKSVVATSALATLLHKRKHLPFEDAKSIARQKIDTCSAFRSNRLSSIGNTASTIYSYTDLVFPTDHHSIEPISIMMGKQFITEQDPEDNFTRTVAINRTVEDRVYRNRMPHQNHNRLNQKQSNIWTDPVIVDGIEQLRIGQNAEHFFFIYLQKQYGTTDVTPTRNWRSSMRLATYPQSTRNVDDSVGYDFELQDTREVFVRGSGSKTKQCYFEVKGTSGSFDDTKTHFHISQNEFDTCRAIAHDERRLKNEAYLIVIIENCLDPEKISLGRIIDWSRYFDSVHRTVDSYTCSLVSQSSLNPNDTGGEGRNYPSTMSQDVRSGNHTAHGVRTNNQISNSDRYVPPQCQNQQQQQQHAVGRTRGGGTYRGRNTRHW